MAEAFPATRVQGLDRLMRFAPTAGRDYATGRNSDLGPGNPGAVSRLSPYLRYRLIDEHEVVANVLGQHGLAGAEKFVQEVLWRTYWKGWLELRPAVWSRYLEEVGRARGPAYGGVLADAENGTTGISGFDDWARELVETGYLHNHARMWFASIWIFTLRLPWALGAEFFLTHLIDADAASNTLSWRWVAGLQTAGKTYLATADNIARYTGGRFVPLGLATHAVALTEPPIKAAHALAPAAAYDDSAPALLLVTHEDLHPESLPVVRDNVNGALIACDAQLLWGDNARRFVAAAATDAASRVAAYFGCRADIAETLDAPGLIAAAQAAGVRQIVTAYASVGPVAQVLARMGPVLASEGITLVPIRRAWDERFWPYATKGFFPFKERIPGLLRELGLT